MKSKKLLSLTLATVILSSTVAMAGNQLSGDFKDIGDHWIRPALDEMLMENVITGYEDKTFRPDNKITREESATVLARFVDKSLVSEGYVGKNFSDVKDRYSSVYIDYLANKKIVKGYEDNTFKPTNNISREEFATIVYRYADSNGMLDNEKKASLKDMDDIASWAKEPVSVLIGNGVIKGMGDGNFKPKNNLTRAEAVQILYEIKTKFMDAKVYKSTNTDVVLLSEARADAEPIKKNSNLSKDTTVEVIEYLGDYALVKPVGIEDASRGYVNKSFLKDLSNDGYEIVEMVALKEIKLLSEPKADAPLIKKNNTLPKDSIVIVEGEATDYYLVKPLGIANASRGYVLKSDLKDNK